MGNTATFDTLRYFETLKGVGFTDEQAKAQANAMREVIEERLATKADLVQLQEKLTNEIQKLELRVTLKFGGMLAAAVAVLAAVITFVK